MTEPTPQERTRLARVAPWSMLGIVLFGVVSTNFGVLVGSAASIFLMVGATFFFPKSGVAASHTYKALFVTAMAVCFFCIATLLPLVSDSYAFGVWLLLYLSAVGFIEVAAIFLEHKENGI